MVFAEACRKGESMEELLIILRIISNGSDWCTMQIKVLEPRQQLVLMGGLSDEAGVALRRRISPKGRRLRSDFRRMIRKIVTALTQFPIPSPSLQEQVKL